jgi:hypothetical protein
MGSQGYSSREPAETIPAPQARRAARRTRRTVVLVAGLLMLWGAVPALASARVGWRLNGTPLTETVATSWTGKVTMTDTKGPAGLVVAVECEETAEGSASVGGTGEVTAIAMSNCTAGQECEKTGKASLTAQNLPWHTELATVEGVLHDVLVSSGKGTPKFKLECRIIAGIKAEDECSGNISTLVTNGVSGVTAAYNKNEKLTCAISGSDTAFLEGSESITAKSGGTLSTEQEEPPVWLAGGSRIVTGKATSWKGTLTLSDYTAPYGYIAVKCEDTGSGLAGGASAGETASWKMSGCVAVSGSNCTSEASIEALDVPWRTELFTSEGIVRDLAAEKGKGKPGFKLKCKTVAGVVTDECRMLPTPSITNATGGVTEAFNEKFTCSQGRAAAGGLEGSQAITLTGGELLQVS